MRGEIYLPSFMPSFINWSYIKCLVYRIHTQINMHIYELQSCVSTSLCTKLRKRLCLSQFSRLSTRASLFRIFVLIWLSVPFDEKIWYRFLIQGPKAERWGFFQFWGSKISSKRKLPVILAGSNRLRWVRSSYPKFRTWFHIFMSWHIHNWLSRGNLVVCINVPFLCSFYV